MAARTLTATIPARLSELPRVRSRLAAWLSDLPLPDLAQYDLCVAAGEALANAIEHGRGPVRFRACVTGGCVHLTVTDHGPGFDPAAVPTPDLCDLDQQRGRGVWLMRALLGPDAVRFGFPAAGGCRCSLRRPL